MNKRRRIMLSLTPVQFNELQILMAEDGQTNFTFYAVYLINQEKKRRAGAVEAPKRPVGRPKNKTEEEDKALYPAPYEGGGAYTKSDWEGYYEFRGEPVPPLPMPLTEKL